MTATLTTLLIVILIPAVLGGPLASREQIEADWRLQIAKRCTSPFSQESILPQEDAAGGCDGHKDGKWGFHTQNEQDPWWQVDLGRERSIESLLLYNRCDTTAKRNARIQVLFSDDGKSFRQAYQHNGKVFYGFTDGKPLRVDFDEGHAPARFVRLQLSGKSYFHLDEVEIFETGSPKNVALNQSASQSSISQWSSAPRKSEKEQGELEVEDTQVVERGRLLFQHLASSGADVPDLQQRFEKLANAREKDYTTMRDLVRQAAFLNPLLDFDDILFVKRTPTMFPHLSDQYYGWWSRPGGGVFILKNFKSSQARLVCLTGDWEPGNFLRPELSYDGKRVLFAYARHYPHVAGIEDKVNKDNLPEDAFYHLYEMNLDGSGVRRLTHGKYDDFDGRYLPNDDIVFLSTRKGQFLQCSMANTAKTLAEPDLPDSYVRCGGGNKRPVPVFTLHAMSGNGGEMRPVSAFETFEYTPSVAADGRILYCRWDYIDRFNGHFFSLWSSNQNGTNAQLVYGNYTKRPQATMEPRSIPGSDKILFTASAHHSIVGGSLVLLDRTLGDEGEAPITRLTPEVPFPETEKNVDSFYANPWPLSEDFFLVSWSKDRLPSHKMSPDQHPANSQGLYLYDRFGNLELIYRDPEISCMNPIPVRSRPKPPGHGNPVDWHGKQMGTFLVTNVYEGLDGVAPGTVKCLRVVGVPPKLQPHMNKPCLGVSREETGKYIIGSAPVEEDGSAWFRVPSGVPVFFQAINEEGKAVQTMRSLTFVQPGQTLSCIGCHESRDTVPPLIPPLALQRPPSKLTPGPKGSWPLRFDMMVQPVLNKACLECHTQGDSFDLSPKLAFDSLLSYANEDLKKLVFEKDFSTPGTGPALNCKLLTFLKTDPEHQSIALSNEDQHRLFAWMDTYAHRQGSFTPEQEHELTAFRQELASELFAEH